MNNLKTYIIEKLHLDKELSIDNDPIITDICEHISIFEDKDEYQKDNISIITDWVNENHVTDVKYYGDHKRLYAGGLDKEMIKTFINKRNTSIKKIFEKLIKPHDKYTKRIVNNKHSFDWVRYIYVNERALYIVDRLITSMDDNDNIYRVIEKTNK